MSDNINLQDVARILNKLDDRLTRIEGKLGNLDGSSVSYSRPRSSYKRHVQTEDFAQDGCNDNVVNRRLDEIYKHGPSLQKSTLPTKSASFRDQPTKRQFDASKRHSFSIPADKEEQKRRSQFQRECLANAIKWNLVDIVTSMCGIPGYSILYHLPYWLTADHIKSVQNAKNEKSRIRQYMLILMEQNFEIMQKWLRQGSLEKRVVEMVWRTYQEFSDKETNTMTVKCFLCRLIKIVPADYVIDYLFSADVISKDTFLQADNSRLPPEADDPLWKRIMSDCKNYSFPKRAIDALRIALNDFSEEFDQNGIKGLLKDIENCNGDSQLLFQCRCSDLCTKSLHPESVMESMSMVQAYMTPSVRHASPEAKRASTSTDTLSPTSSPEILEKLSESDSRSSDEEQTYRKIVSDKSQNGENGTKEKLEIDTKVLSKGRPITERPNRRVSKKVLQRRQDSLECQRSSTDFTDSEKVDEKQRNSSALTRPRCANYTKQQSTQAVQNNPQIIYGKNVYISHI